MKKKKVYLLRDSAGGDIRAELKENGKLTFNMEFPRPIFDEEELYGVFTGLNWDLKHEEFQPDYPPGKQDPVYVPEDATFH